MANEEIVFPGPTKEEMDKLISSYGKIFRVALSVDEVFYIRRIKRAEYKRILEVVGKADMALREDLLNEKLLETAVVWSQPKIDGTFLSDSGAGVIPTVALQVMDRSGFTQPLVEEVK